MKVSNILFSLLLVVGVGAYADEEKDRKQEREQAREKMESARKQMQEAQRNYRQSLKELRELQMPHSRWFGTDGTLHEWLPHTFDHFAQPRIWHLHDRVTPNDFNVRILSGGHWGAGVNSQLQMVALNAELGRYFGADEGVLVLDAAKDNIYELQPGDVILAINGREPRSANRVMQLLRTYEPEETVTLSIMRDKKKRTLEPTIPGSTALLGHELEFWETL